MTNFVEQVEGAIRATVFHGRNGYSWFGRPCPRLTPRARRDLGERAIQQMAPFPIAMAALWSFLLPGNCYRRSSCHWRPFAAKRSTFCRGAISRQLREGLLGTRLESDSKELASPAGEAERI